MRLIRLLLIVLACLSFASCDAGVDGEERATVLVMVAHDEGVTVEGDNPRRAYVGESVVFDITLDDDFSIVACEGATYADGRLTVENVTVPLTIEVISRKLDEYSFSFSDEIVSSVEAGQYKEGTKITVSAPEKKNGKLFIGYSHGAALEDGGVPVSYIREYSFELEGELSLYPNYASEGASLIVYNANGGQVTGGGEAICVEWKNSVYTCPNSLINKDYFTREGYVLAGYNTESDGSGRYYGCGWNIVMPESDVAQLYCQWLKVTDESKFEYSEKSGTITITKYNGDDEIVVIPETIGGKTVKRIFGEAFRDEEFHTLYISRNVEVILDKAVLNCKNLKTLYFSDGVKTVSDNSFVGCGELSTLYLQATVEPRYISTRNGTYQIKYERLMTASSPKIVITGGSNVAYGVDSARLEAALGNKYNVVNYGCNVSTSAAFYLEVISHFAGEGDILIHAPENSETYQYGNNTINTTLWQIFEGAYDAFSLVDIRHYTKLFSSFASFNSSRLTMKAQDYEKYTSQTVNSYGDYIMLKTGTNYTPSYSSRAYSTTVIKSGYVSNLNRVLEMCRESGMTLYLSFGAVNIESLTEDSRGEVTQTAFMLALMKNFAFDKRISDVGDFAMESRYFFNSDYHLTTEGSHVRTDRLAKDILAALANNQDGRG